MKRLFILTVLSVMCSLMFSETYWLKRSDIEAMRLKEDFGLDASAVAYCTTKEEVEKICRITNLEWYFYSVSSGDQNYGDVYCVIFLYASEFTPRIVVMHYTTGCAVEFYYIFN